MDHIMPVKKERTTGNVTYTTNHELAFINSLIKGRTPGRAIVLLEKYEESMKIRTEWGSVDPERIRKRVAYLKTMQLVKQRNQWGGTDGD